MSPLASYITQTGLTLLGIILISWLILVAGRRAGVSSSSGSLELVARLPLDGRRAVYLVKAGERVLVLGGSEAGLAKLAELADVPRTSRVQAKASFGQMMQRILNTGRVEAEEHPAPEEVSNSNPPEAAAKSQNAGDPKETDGAVA